MSRRSDRSWLQALDRGSLTPLGKATNSYLTADEADGAIHTVIQSYDLENLLMGSPTLMSIVFPETAEEITWENIADELEAEPNALRYLSEVYWGNIVPCLHSGALLLATDHLAYQSSGARRQYRGEILRALNAKGIDCALKLAGYFQMQDALNDIAAGLFDPEAGLLNRTNLTLALKLIGNNWNTFDDDTQETLRALTREQFCRIFGLPKADAMLDVAIEKRQGFEMRLNQTAAALERLATAPQ